MQSSPEPTAFERVILAACALDESALRTQLESALVRHGFAVRQDSYEALPQPRTPQRNVRNLLAVRGRPRVCLVVHTDVVRDWREPTGVLRPVVCYEVVDGRQRRVITDETRETPIGGDDRLGVAIAMRIARATRDDLAILFTTDEERGLCGAEEVPGDWLESFELLVQIDRGNHRNQLVTSIHGTRLCERAWERRLIAIADRAGLPRAACEGLSTDVYALVRRGIVRNAVNLTCGYYANHRGEEWIDVEEADETARYVRAIVGSVR